MVREGKHTHGAHGQNLVFSNPWKEWAAVFERGDDMKSSSVYQNTRRKPGHS
jgi:hypothetical protein